MMLMSDRTISVTEAARGFSDLINRVRYLGESAVLVKNRTPVARIAPVTAEPTRCTAAELAGRLPVLQLPPEEADRFSLQVSLNRRTVGAAE